MANRMNGDETAAFASAIFGSSSTNGRDAPEARQAQSEGEPPVGSDGVFFPHSWSRHPKKRQRKARRASGIDDGAEASRYQVEHLSTLALERKAGLLTAEDGVRRLRLLDAKGKIWTQDVLLRVRRHDVSLLDADAECELEVFPLSAVQQCQAVTNACGFDSILALVCKDSGQRKADLHLFQCDHVKAHLIRADIQSALTDAKGGGPKKRPDVLKMIRNSRGEIPPPPAAPAPEPPTGPEDGESRADARSDRGGGRRTTTPPSSEDGTAAVVDRDVQILNRLLDDIEAFIGQLQKAAEACGQLARRKQNKKAAKKRTPGGGPPTQQRFCRSMAAPADRAPLSSRGRPDAALQSARPPPLPRLSAEVQVCLQPAGETQRPHPQPRRGRASPLPVHPPENGGPGFGRRRRGPRRDGPAAHPRRRPAPARRRHRGGAPAVGRAGGRMDQWPKDRYVPPVFADGWEPPAREAGREAGSPSTEEACPRPLAARPPVLEEDAESERAGGHQAKLNKRFAKSKYDFVARNNTELSVLKDELVEVLDDRKQWWKVRNGDGLLGYVPNNILDAAAPAVDVTGRGEAVYSHTIQLMMPRKEFEMFKQLLGELNEKQTGARAQTLSGKDVLSPAPPAGLPAPPPPPPPPPAIDAAADRDDGGAGTFATREREVHHGGGPGRAPAAPDVGSQRPQDPGRGLAPRRRRKHSRRQHHVRVVARRRAGLAGGQGLQSRHRRESGGADGGAALLAQQGRAEDGLPRRRRSRLQPGHRAEGRAGVRLRAAGGHEEASGDPGGRRRRIGDGVLTKAPPTEGHTTPSLASGFLPSFLPRFLVRRPSPLTPNANAARFPALAENSVAM